MIENVNISKTRKPAILVESHYSIVSFIYVTLAHIQLRRMARLCTSIISTEIKKFLSYI